MKTIRIYEEGDEDMRLFFQLIFDGLAMGLVYVLLAAGNVLICSVNKIIMVSYGMFYTIGAYFTWYLSEETNLPKASLYVLPHLAQPLWE